MSKVGNSKKAEAANTPYRRIAILGAGLLAIIIAFAAVNMIAHGVGGDEKKLITAVINTLQQPRINGQVSLSQRSQTNTFNVTGAFTAENLKKISIDATVEGLMQDKNMRVPVKAYADLSEGEFFVRISETAPIVDMVGAAAPPLKDNVASVAQKIDSKWLHMSQKNLKDNDCSSKLMGKLTADKAAGDQLAKVYAKNRFINVQDSQDKGDHSREYTVLFDKEAYNKFIKAFQTSDLVKSIDGCDKVFAQLNAMEEEVPQQALDQARQATPEAPAPTIKLTVKDENVVNITTTTSANNQMSTNRIALNFSKGATPKAPTEDIVPYSDIEADVASLGKLFQGMIQQQQAAQANTPAM